MKNTIRQIVFQAALLYAVVFWLLVAVIIIMSVYFFWFA